jgi:hypothetical protein
MDKIGDWLIALLFVAGIFVLVRPGSQGPQFVNALTSGTVNLVNAATGGGKWGDK